MTIDAVLSASPPFDSVNLPPLSVDEIDALSESARIWATISAIKIHHEKELLKAFDDGANTIKTEY